MSFFFALLLPMRCFPFLFFCSGDDATRVTMVVRYSEVEANKRQFNHLIQLWDCRLKNGELQKAKVFLMKCFWITLEAHYFVFTASSCISICSFVTSIQNLKIFFLSFLCHVHRFIKSRGQLK